MKYHILLLMFVLLSVCVIAEDKFVLKQVAMGDFENPIFEDTGHRIAVLFPLILLLVVIVLVMLDFLAVGVTAGSLLILIIGVVFKILPITWPNAMSMIIIGIILIYKMAT